MEEDSVRPESGESAYPGWFQDLLSANGCGLPPEDSEFLGFLDSLDDAGREGFREHFRQRLERPAGTVRYRDKDLTVDEAVGDLERVQRLEETGGDWDPAQQMTTTSRGHKDRPSDWQQHEQAVRMGDIMSAVEED